MKSLPDTAPLPAQITKKPAVSGQQAYNLNWFSVIIWGGLDSRLFCGCMHHFPIAYVQGHMIGAPAPGVKQQISRLHLVLCYDLAV